MQFDTHYKYASVVLLFAFRYGIEKDVISLKRTNWTDKSFIGELYPIILLKISFVSGIPTKVI